METYENQRNCYQLCLLLFNNHVDLKINERNYRKFVWFRSWQTIKLPTMLLWKRHLRLRCTSFERSWGQCHRSLASQLAAISNHCLGALPAKMCAFNSHMRQNANIVTWILEDLLPCYCYTIKTNSKTIHNQRKMSIKSQTVLKRGQKKAKPID